VLQALLKEGTPAARKVVGRIAANPLMLDLGWERARLLRILAAADMPDCYRYYLPLLDIKGSSLGSHRYAEGTVVAEVIASEIVKDFAPDDPEILRIARMFPTPEEQIAPLKEWLRAKAKAAAIASGK
jgi:hypothetical protein